MKKYYGAGDLQVVPQRRAEDQRRPMADLTDEMNQLVHTMANQQELSCDICGENLGGFDFGKPVKDVFVEFDRRQAAHQMSGRCRGINVKAGTAPVEAQTTARPQ